MNCKWSKKDKEIAKKAFNNAYNRECMSLINEVNGSNIQNPEQLWNLCDRLCNRRKEIEEKYDYRYSVLIFVFARLIKDGYLNYEELSGISREIIEKIKILLKS